MTGIIVFIKNNQEILLDLANFALQEPPEDNVMVSFSWTLCNGSYLKLDHCIMQFQGFDWISGHGI